MKDLAMLSLTAVLAANAGLAIGDPLDTADSTASHKLDDIYATVSADQRSVEVFDLSCWLSSTNADDISDKTIDRIEGLMEDPNDKVKIYATFALSALGPRAARALPRLEDIKAKTSLVNGYGWPNPVYGTIQIIEGKDPAGRKRLHACGSPPF